MHIICLYCIFLANIVLVLILNNILFNVEERFSEENTNLQIAEPSPSMKMRRLSPYQKGVAQLKILQILNEVEWSVIPQPNVNQPYTNNKPYQSTVQFNPSHFQQIQQKPTQMNHLFRSLNTTEVNQQDMPNETREMHKYFNTQLQD